MTIDLKRALVLLDLLDPANKYETMLRTAAILTKLLEQNNVKPIIVGGFSVEIYTNRDYSTYDIDIVTSDIVTVANILEKLGFIKEGRHFYHERLKIAIEFPDDILAGSLERISKIDIDENDGLYVIVISVEDIIMDRLRASIYWNESESKIWGMKMLADYFDQLDLEYMKEVGKGAETERESNEIDQWVRELIELRG
jgi:predicted nucleotidyltransferase